MVLKWICQLALIFLYKNILFMYISLQIYATSKIQDHSPKETICMKCQIIFSRKNKKNIISLSSAEFVHSRVRIKKIAWKHSFCSFNFELMFGSCCCHVGLIRKFSGRLNLEKSK